MPNTLENVAAPTAVAKTLTVACPLERAFTVFTDCMGAWWPATHHIGTTPFRDIVIEHATGGRWYEIDEHGEQCRWGQVLAWDPPHRVAVSWHLGPDWTFNPSLDHASEVEVTFFRDSAESTRVELVHRCIERHGTNFAKLRDDVDSPGGWSAILLAYRTSAEEVAQ